MRLISLARSILVLALVVIASAAPARIAGADGSATRAGQPAPQSRFGALPASFEVNRGQADRRVRFLTRGSGYTLFLTDTAAVMAMPGNAVMRLRYEGANPHPRIVGSGRLLGTVNYFLGADRSRWHTDIPTYARVEYRNLYPRIDLAFHGAAPDSGGLRSPMTSGVEYDWVLHPGAQVSRIRLDVEGAARVSLDRAGNLVLTDRGVRLVQRLPVAYQRFGGVRHLVSVRYTLPASRAANGTGSGLIVGLTVGSYDHARPLVIDPTLVYSTYLGGGSGEGAQAIAIDGKGDAYVTGDTFSPDFPTAHPIQRTLRSDSSCPSDLGASGGICGDAFVSKLSADGSTLLYSTFLGGALADYGYAIAVDRAGDAYVTGGTTSSDFPSKNALQRGFNGGTDLGDVFVTKLSPTGDQILFSTFLGGSGDQDGQGIAVEGGKVYVTGRTDSPSFPLSHPLEAHLGSRKCHYPFQTGSVRCYAAFVSKLSGDGKTLEYSTYLGGSRTAFGWALAVYHGRAVVAGQTTGDFPVSHAVQPAFAGGQCGVPGQSVRCDDVFVSELAPSGNALVFSTYLGGANDDIAHGVAVDRSGNVLVVGETSSHHFPTVNAIESQFGGDADVGFVAKFDPPGSRLLYSTFLGGSGGAGDEAYAVATDPAGDAYVVGSTTSSNFPVVHAFDGRLAGSGDAQNGFITKLSPAGSALLYSSYLGGNDHDLVGSVAVDAAGNAYVDGWATSKNFPTAHPLQRRLAGGMFDAIVAKIGG